MLSIEDYKPLSFWARLENWVRFMFFPVHYDGLAELEKHRLNLWYLPEGYWCCGGVKDTGEPISTCSESLHAAIRGTVSSLETGVKGWFERMDALGDIHAIKDREGNGIREYAAQEMAKYQGGYEVRDEEGTQDGRIV